MMEFESPSFTEHRYDKRSKLDFTNQFGFIARIDGLTDKAKSKYLGTRFAFSRLSVCMQSEEIHMLSYKIKLTV